MVTGLSPSSSSAPGVRLTITLIAFPHARATSPSRHPSSGGLGFASRHYRSEYWIVVQGTVEVALPDVGTLCRRPRGRSLGASERPRSAARIDSARGGFGASLEAQKEDYVYVSLRGPCEPASLGARSALASRPQPVAGRDSCQPPGPFTPPSPNPSSDHRLCRALRSLGANRVHICLDRWDEATVCQPVHDAEGEGHAL